MESDTSPSRGKPAQGACPDCGDQETGAWVGIPYEGRDLNVFVRVCGCGIEVQLIRQRTAEGEPPCPFCDHVGPDGIPGMTHTHETLDKKW